MRGVCCLLPEPGAGSAPEFFLGKQDVEKSNPELAKDNKEGEVPFCHKEQLTSSVLNMGPHECFKS